MPNESTNAQEPMCALDPLLLIPRIEYVKDIYKFVASQARDYCLVILDMKNFHLVNDIYGYDTGDLVIERFIRELRQRLPSGSISLRFRHGDEFLFFMPIHAAGAEIFFKDFSNSCETMPALTVREQDEIFVSFRFAVLQLVHFNEGVGAILARAEKALREVKGQGSPRY